MTYAYQVLMISLSNLGAWFGAITGWREELEWGLRIFATVAAAALSIVSIWAIVRKQTHPAPAKEAPKS
jgi:predicted MFS family arabinose efflux permease